jgi:hypothetical protein
VNEPLTIETFTLEWLKLAAQRRVSAEFAESVTPAVYRDTLWGDLVHQLTARVLADQLPPETVTDEHTFVFPVPGSPWQQFKATHADSWWLRWLTKMRPPTYVKHYRNGSLTVDLRRYHIYPQARVSPQLGQPYRTFVMEKTARYWPEAVTDE